jgi:hypothetical protein
MVNGFESCRGSSFCSFQFLHFQFFHFMNADEGVRAPLETAIND